MPEDITKVLVNTLPLIHSGPKVAYSRTVTPVFFDDNTRLIFQAILHYIVLNGGTNDILYEFKTRTLVAFPRPSSEDEVVNLGFAFYKSAVAGFNWHIKDKCSKSTFYKPYFEPMTEKVIEAIRAASRTLQPYNPIMDN